MKKLIFISCVFILASILVLSGCGGTTPAPSTSTSTSTSTTPAQPPPTSVTSSGLPPSMQTTTSTTTTTPAAGQPQYGGILRIVRQTFPHVIGYTPEFAPADSIFALPAIERLCEWNQQGIEIPVLAESWDMDPVGKTITWHLRHGVQFTDGTPFNADAVKWNYQLRMDAGKLTDSQYIDSIEVVDDYTLVMHLNDFNNMMIETYGWLQCISPTAFEKAGGGDIEKSKEWARAHSVGTGPFIVSNFERDNVIEYTKNPNYWRPGMPYLDGMVIRFIPDTMTASALMEAGQVDAWSDVAAVQNVIDLQKKGFVVNKALGFFWAILPDSSNPDSPFAKKEVREAVEYALDRPAIATMIGQGEYEALTEMAVKDWPGYVPNFDPRPYNPDKARQLLKDAGYPKGFQTTLLVTSTGVDAASAIQGYLGQVGISVKVDVADMGRYFGEVFGTGWTGLAFAASGINPDTTDLFVHFGPNPWTYRTGTIAKSQAFLDLCQQALHTYDQAAYIDIIKKAVVQGSADAMIIPVYKAAQFQVQQPYVHSDYVTLHTVIWTSYDDWMAKH
jgi:peptide/nickel transport system substrate-binding protein